MKSLKLSKGSVLALRLAHRNGGVVLAFFLILLSITGVMLNHTQDLGLNDIGAPSLIASRYYDVQEVLGYSSEDRYFYSAANTLYMDQIAVGNCESAVDGVAQNGADFIVLCAEELTIVSASGQLIESIGAAHGLPSGITALGNNGPGLVIKSPAGSMTFDPMTLTATPIDTTVYFPEPVIVPADILLADVVTWEQFILDLHSGMFLGAGGVWLADFVALVIVLLSISGILMWLLPRRDNGSS